MTEVLGMKPNKISDLTRIKDSAGRRFKLEKKDLKNFTVPLKMFREYCKAIKSLNKELQDMILASMGVDVPKNPMDEDLPEMIKKRRMTKLIELEKKGI